MFHRFGILPDESDDKRVRIAVKNVPRAQRLFLSAFFYDGGKAYNESQFLQRIESRWSYLLKFS